MANLTIAFFSAFLLLGTASSQDHKSKAPELHGGKGWLNTDKPVRMKELRGKIVLLDFWTYC